MKITQLLPGRCGLANNGENISPRILLLDIETSPNIGYTWNKYETDVIEFIQNWQLLSFAYKWLGGKTKVVALPDFPGYKAGGDDKKLVGVIWYLLDQADIVIAQNGDRFDFRKINTRFIHHKMDPPSPYKTIDTLKIARQKFGFNSNKLNDLGKDLGVGEKFKHEGFGLWKGCMAGEKKAWAMMKKYNKQDVDLLEKIYLRFRPWHKTHPNLDTFNKHVQCPKCGSDDLQKRGTAITQNMTYTRFQCQKCGGWSRGIRGERTAMVTNA